MSEIEALNRALFLKMNASPGAPQWLIDFATLVADDLIYLVPLLLIALWIRGQEERRSSACRAALVTLVALSASQIILLFWQHPRPDVIGLGHTWISHAADSSFPSDHATVFVSVGLALFLDGAAVIGGATLAVGVVVAWARILLGVHFPLDMLGSIGVAIVSYLMVLPLWRLAGKTITRALQQVYRVVIATLSIPIEARRGRN